MDSGELLPDREHHDVRICGFEIRGMHPGFPGLHEVVFKLNIEPHPLWVSMFEAHQKEMPGGIRRRDPHSVSIRVYRDEAHWSASREQIVADTSWIERCIEAANEDFSAYVLRVWQEKRHEIEKHTAEQKEIEELRSALRRFGGPILPGLSRRKVQSAAEVIAGSDSTGGDVPLRG